MIPTPLSFRVRVISFILSLFLNSFGNALAISTLMGSVIWTASGMGIAELLHLHIGNALVIYGAFVILLNICLERKLVLYRVIGNFIFMFPFSYFIQGFTMLFQHVGVENLPFTIRLLLNILSIVIIAIAVALYQRANIVMHPNDDLMYIIRYKFTKGKATMAQFIAYILPVSLTLLAFFFTKEWIGIGVGTILSFLLQGSLVDATDKWLTRKTNTLPS